jgi:hypothetical protein
MSGRLAGKVAFITEAAGVVEKCYGCGDLDRPGDHTVLSAGGSLSR